MADARGAFAVRHVAAGRWEVLARAPGCAEARAEVVVPQSRGLEVVPRPFEALGGRVEFEDGAPVVGAGVHAWEADEDGQRSIGQGANYGARTDAQGRWRLADLRPGRFLLQVQGSADVNLVHFSDNTIRSGATGLRIVVRRGATISGRVVDAEGNGVAGIALYGRQGKDRIRGQCRSGTDGRFVVFGLPPGAFTV
ncbi:MAG: carboxypeptidase-like regulatory domain-containing protein, partial [Myxococcota bacterium]